MDAEMISSQLMIDKINFQMIYNLLQNYVIDILELEQMDQYYCDGSTSGLCGNGARCIVKYAKSLGIIQQKAHFITNQKEYFADIVENNVRLHVQNPIFEEINGEYSIINTGSRHIVFQTNDLQNKDIKKMGSDINSSEKFKQNGLNVNYYEQIGNSIYLRTYERGVNDETLACGTGALATAIAICISQKLYGNQRVDLSTKGGLLRVELEHNQNMITNVRLEGPGQFVYSGQIQI